MNEFEVIEKNLCCYLDQGIDNVILVYLR